MIKNFLTKSSKILVNEAKKQISNLTAKEALILHKDKRFLFIDLRDIRELEKTGKISKAKHVPRGMLEFWIDPDSPYHKDIFNQDKKYVFYCAAAGRSALAAKAAQDMGLNPVSHLEGGFAAWKKSGNPIETKE